MQTEKPFRLGVIEGFFGRQWRWEDRHAHAGFLAGHGCNTYIYAPKNDRWLRRDWQLPYPEDELRCLQELARHCRDLQLDFGIGLSPFELYRDFSPANRALLKQKLTQLNSVAPQTLCILFDDMLGNLQDLARVQLDIVDFIRTVSSASSFALCPTYYSHDPLLTRHFGPQPEAYLEDLGAGLERSIDIFWTGPTVISTHYPRHHMEEVAQVLRRKPLLWDNYPVNDAKRLTSFLHLLPFRRNGPELRTLVTGHLANPMNEAWLSQLPLYCLPALYSNEPYEPDTLFSRACRELCPPELAAALQADAASFSTVGLEGMTEREKQHLLQRYCVFTHPVASEVCAWLRGEYAFDPACLT